MEQERIVFVGGPLDGMTQTYAVGMGLIAIPVRVSETTEPVMHRYGQADMIDPGEQSLSEDGARRYLHMGEGMPAT